MEQSPPLSVDPVCKSTQKGHTGAVDCVGGGPVSCDSEVSSAGVAASALGERGGPSFIPGVQLFSKIQGGSPGRYSTLAQTHQFEEDTPDTTIAFQVNHSYKVVDQALVYHSVQLDLQERHGCIGYILLKSAQLVDLG